MSKVNSYNLNSAELDSLRESYAQFHYIYKSLRVFLNEEFSNKMENSLMKLKTGLAGVFDEDQEALNATYDYFEKIREDNKFLSIWSLNAKIGTINQPIKLTRPDIHEALMSGAKVYYGSLDSERRWNFSGRDLSDYIKTKQEHAFPGHSHLTWMDLWVVADSLIVESGDDRHIYIKDFRVTTLGDVEGTTKFNISAIEVITGS
jgi:phage pi2 protein 07